MAVTVHHNFRMGGDERRMFKTLDLVRSSFEDLPLRRVGEILHVSQFKFRDELITADVQARDRSDMAAWLGTHFQSHFHVEELPTHERAVTEQAILRDGNGLGFCVDVDEGCDLFRLVLGRMGDGGVWHGWGFTKTGWAEGQERAHSLVVEMLEICEAADILESVNDEAGVWEARTLE